MTATTMISSEDLWNLVGTPDCPVVIDALYRRARDASGETEAGQPHAGGAP